ncbi:hypothetical protein QYE76_002413 [Lolium multiflorum]|uniref:Uncharacterized protein n=1 Tax=Lolium multiflorum TaxID=4521 RepID=A0AAD8W089_LOLMU|nr:hypothetical protein QYE76_002413 [Lolium multiflorum]
MSIPPPSSSHPPPHSAVPAVLSAEITAALHDLTTAIQEIRLFLAGPYGPPPVAALQPWQPTHQAASAAIAGPLQPTLLLSSPPPDAGLLQSPLPLSTISGPDPTSASGVPLLQQPATFFPTGTLQQQQQLPPPPTPPMQLLSSPMLSLPFGGQLQQQLPSPPTPQQRLLPPPTPSLPFGGVGATLAPGSTSTPPGMPFHQVCFPPSPSPLPAWIAIRHVSAAVRLQAAARGLLVRRRVREMRDLQLQLLQVALHCATDLDLVRCVGDLGRTVSPTGGGHAVFPAGSDLKVCAIDSHSAGRRHGVTDRSAPRSTTAFRRRPPRGLLLSRWFPWDPATRQRPPNPIGAAAADGQPPAPAVGTASGHPCCPARTDSLCVARLCYPQICASSRIATVRASPVPSPKVCAGQKAPSPKLFVRRASWCPAPEPSPSTGTHHATQKRGEEARADARGTF